MALSVEQIYERCGAIVERRARHILGSADAAREVLQDVFVSLMTTPTRPPEEHVVPWLYTATTRACLNRIRDGKTRSRLLSEHGPAPVAMSTVGSASAEHSVELRRLLERLPDEFRNVAVSYFLDEMSHEEIAIQLGCSRRHVGNLVERLLAAVASMEST